MATSVTGTGITFPDATTQTTAAVSAPSFGAVGSIAMLYYINAAGATINNNIYEIPANTSLSGSSLRYVSLAAAWYNFNNSYGYINNLTNLRFSATGLITYLQGATQTSGVTALTGTWRVLQGGIACMYFDEGCSSYVYRFLPVLMQRIS